MKKLSLISLAFSLMAVIFMLVPGHRIFAQSDSENRQALLDKFAPVLYFHTAELFRPQPVDVLVDNARLRQNRAFWFDTNILSRVSISDLFAYRESDYFLDAWYGDEELSDNMNYSFHRFYYETVLRPQVGGPPIVAYGRVVEDDVTRAIVLQYWLFYYYNDWFNKHEGDWELIQVMLDADGQPQHVVLSQHHGGTRRVWRDTQKEEGTHPVAYVALGSHANYFWGDEVYPNGQDVGNTRVEIIDRTGSVDRVIPDVIPLPRADDVVSEPDFWLGSEWLLFGGKWGETAPVGDFGGPSGPTQKGEQWQQPYKWGLDQPLDVDTWYANRLRVQVLAEAGANSTIRLLTTDGERIPTAEQSTHLAILHRDPNPGEVIHIEIDLVSGPVQQVIATWPDAVNAQVERFIFENLPPIEIGQYSLSLSSEGAPKLFVDETAESIRPSQNEIFPATWDAVDFVWMVNLLPASDIAEGVFISTIGALIPILLFMSFVYWVDRYEKEPKRLMAVVFFWGAIPTLVFSLLSRLFIRLPINELTPIMVAAVRTGLIIPLIEEVLKGAIILFILLRHRREFDNSLDGIVYGSLVGFGFGLSRNLVGSLSAFFVHGFSALSTETILSGAVFALNQAAYTAIFGAGLGYARMCLKSWPRIVVPLLAFLLAVGTHIFHNLAVQAAVGLNLLTMALTLGSLLLLVVIASLSLRRQGIWINEELKDQLPENLYEVVIRSTRRARAQWLALFSQGYRGWRKVRRLHQTCTEMAFKLRQSRMFPNENGLSAEAEVSRREIAEILGKKT